MKDSGAEIQATVSHWAARLGETQKRWAQAAEGFIFVRDRKGLMVEGEDWRVERQAGEAITVTFYEGGRNQMLALAAATPPGE